MDRIRPELPANFNGLVIIGESPGKDEIEQGLPFVGRSGKLLDTVLTEVGVVRSQCLVTNVFLSRPERDKIDQFFRVAGPNDSEFVARYGLYRNKVVRDENRLDIERLDQELITHQPTLMLLLGATALWRLTQTNGITTARGKWVLTQFPGISHLTGILPTWHPSAVLRDRGNKLPQFISDIQLVKAVLDRVNQ